MTTDHALAFLVAAATGFLVGRTRSARDGKEAVPGIRDFVIVAVTGCLCAWVEQPVVTALAGVGLLCIMVVARVHNHERRGITTEFSAILVFVLGYMCATPLRSFATAVAVILAMVLSRKETLHRFALRVITKKEFDDILSFLALILVVFPLLPEGGYGPFEFFEPRKIWIFVILVCSISFVGYFLVKFVGARSGTWLTAALGGLASTTAYTGSASKDVKANPEAAVRLAGATLLANSIMFPRILLILAAINQSLASQMFPVAGAMTLAGATGAWLLCGKGLVSGGHQESNLSNPFSLWPALKLGLMFAVVLFITKAGRAWLGSGSEFLTAAIGGLLDVDAVLLSLASANIEPTLAMAGILIAAASNAVFKIGLAISSGVAAFYGRVILGFLIIFSVGAAALFA